jgi:dTDP-glucose 4,6-dehydratase
VLLNAVRDAGVERFLHVSTDEVYGDVPAGHSSKETDSVAPRSPYSASKTGGDLQCLAFHQSFGTPVMVTRASNNFGPYQHVEKALPLFITNAVDDEPIPLYGDGKNIRDWLFVEDHCSALDLVLREGQPGEVYNIGAGNERENIDVLRRMLDLLGKPHSLIRFVADRPGHDRRYSIDSSKVRAMGWAPAKPFEERLAETVAWYRDNRGWWEHVRSGEFRDYYERMYGQRLAEAEAAPGE